MRFARPRSSGFQSPLAPLLDVVLLLLIFFVVTSSFASPTLELELPPATAGGEPVANAIVVAIDEKGAIRIDGRPESPESLADRFVRAKVEMRSIELRADRATDFEHVVAVLDLAQSVGIEGVSFAVAPGAGSP